MNLPSRVRLTYEERIALKQAINAELRRRHNIVDRTPVRRKPIRHGENAGYVAGCHCQPCKIAHAEYGRSWYLRQKEKAA